MLTLVTQPDGSARRFPFVTLLLLAGMAYLLAQQWDGMQSARTEARELHSESVAYFHKNPFVEVDTRFEVQLGSDLIAGLREEFYESRKRLGMAEVPERIMERSQKRFDGLVNSYRERFADIPAQRFGLSRGFEKPENLAAHAVVHPSLGAFLLGALLILLVGIVLEDVWGSVVYGAFLCFATVATGLAAVGLSPELWYGSCGIVGALLGAAVARQFAEGSPRLLGAIPMPSWFLAGMWLLAEVGLIYGMGPEFLTLHSPAPHLAAVGIGVGLGLAIRSFGFEEALAARWDDGESVNPVYDKAMELRERGKLDEAHQILIKEHARDTKNRDIAMALWDVCRDRGEPQEAIGAAKLLIAAQLREGATAAAAKQWIEVSDQVPASQLDLPANLCARIADALVGEEEPERATDVLRLALTSRQQQPAAMVWVAQLANDLDPALARQAASIAYANPRLDPSERAALIELVGEVDPEEFARSAPASEPAFSAGDSGEIDPALDPGALDPDAFAADDVAGDAAGDRGLELSTASHDDASSAAPWSAQGGEDDLDMDALDPNALALDDLATEAAPGGEAPDSVFSESEPAVDAMPDLGRADHPEPADQHRGIEASSDIDPHAIDLDAIDDLDLDSDEIDGLDLGDIGDVAECESDALDPHDAPTELTDPGEIPPPAAHEALDAPTTPLIVDRSPARSVSQVTASPSQIGPESLTIELDDGRRLSVDWGRVDAIAVAAVGDLSAKPVVLIDLALNWSEAAADSLRVIRLRSDRFDPRPLTGVEDPLGALRALTLLLADASGGVPLPDAGAVAGQPFAMYDTLARYEREVLLGVRT